MALNTTFFIFNIEQNFLYFFYVLKTPISTIFTQRGGVVKEEEELKNHFS